MKSLSFVLVAAVVLGLAGCGGGGGSASGGGSGGGKHASIDITLAGALSGHSTQLDPKQPADCLDASGVKVTEITQTTLFPVINGKVYSFNISVNKFKSAPLTIQVPDPSNNLGFSIEDTTNPKDAWLAFKASGTVSLNADINSGHAEVKHMENSDPEDSRTIDLTATWSC